MICRAEKSCKVNGDGNGDGEEKLKGNCGTAHHSAHRRDQMVAVAWRALRLSEQTMKLLWDIFEEEFMERIDAAGREDERGLPF